MSEKIIKTLREKKGWSQFELALKLGVHPSSLSEWENGRRSIPSRYQVGLAFLLDVPFIEGTSHEKLLNVLHLHIKNPSIELADSILHIFEKKKKIN